jgi:Protein of unknown function (DUF4232)
MAPSLTFAARLAAAGLVAAGAAGLLAGCGTASPNPSPTQTVTQTIQPAAGGSASASPAAVTTTSAPPAGPPGCLASGLQAQLGVSQGTLGTIYQVVVLTNTSAATCTLYGYPGVSFVTGQGGSQVGAPASKNTVITPVLVTLAPGGKADVLLAVHDAGAYSPSSCGLTSVGWLKIYPPGDYGSLYVQYNTQACAKPSLSIMSVTAVRSGAGSASY